MPLGCNLQESIQFPLKLAENKFFSLRLTSPVTKCLPSGEKARAVMVFLLIREEEQVA